MVFPGIENVEEDENSGISLQQVVCKYFLNCMQNVINYRWTALCTLIKW